MTQEPDAHGRRTTTGWAGHAAEMPLDEERLARALDEALSFMGDEWTVDELAASVAKAYREDEQNKQGVATAAAAAEEARTEAETATVTPPLP